MDKRLVYKKCGGYRSIGVSVNKTKFVATQSDDIVVFLDFTGKR